MSNGGPICARGSENACLIRMQLDGLEVGADAGPATMVSPHIRSYGNRADVRSWAGSEGGGGQVVD